VIIDLIDMESAGNREKVYRALQESLRADKARTNILKISELGPVEMTRKRTRENLVQTLCEPCSYCEGRGYVLSRESVAFKVLREIRTDLPRFGGRQIAITVSPQVAEELLTSGQDVLSDLTEQLGREIEIRARPGLHQEQFEVTALDEGEPVSIPLRWLGDKDPDEAEAEAEAAEPTAIAQPESTPDAESAAAPVEDPGAEPAELAEQTEGAEPEAQQAEPKKRRRKAAVPVPEAPEVPAGLEPTEVAAASDEVGSLLSSQSQTGAATPTLDDGPESRILPPSQEHGDT